jgi:uncharacterized protein YlxW (UPF0749 family)
MPDPRPDAPAQPPTARDRLRASFFSRPGRGQWIAAGLLFTLGFAGATQVARQSDDDLTGLRQTDLVRAFDGLAASTERAEKEIDRLRTDRDRLKSSTNSRQTAVELAKQEQTALGILSGTIAARGSGVRITITDPDGKVTAALLLDAVQEMRDAGAEVIEFNDQVRVVAQTWLESDGTTVIVDGTKLQRPYTMDVIGDPHSLQEAAQFRGGLVSEITGARIGGTVTIEQLDTVEVTSLHSAPDNQYARPASAAPTPR